ncbi:alpha/beta fold hydrolase [Pseudoclavibacter sp. AY1F1]|uniref:alpha/beta fold hydrolase n=1 Tax=Pseudoclavibacter sp. AY1F1 TaxID=2080583 RepID=UPI0011AFFFF2|nr:alpha/beta hydrolase [Pseudoclavibacter sp. AY1F1]
MMGEETNSPVRALRAVSADHAQESRSAPQSLRVDLEGGSVEVLVRVSSEGRKHDNLLLLGEVRAATAGTLAGLLPDAHVLAPSISDLGWGRSAHNESAATARAVVQLLDHFSVERAVLVGTEAGAELAIAVAAAHPDRVGALVLLNGGLGEVGLGEVGDGDARAASSGASSRDALSGLRVPVAFLFGGSAGESVGYTAASVNAITAWLRHVEAQEVATAEPEDFDAQALALVADIVQAQLASVRARAAHPATGSHRVITPADDES